MEGAYIIETVTGRSKLGGSSPWGWEFIVFVAWTSRCVRHQMLECRVTDLKPNHTFTIRLLKGPFIIAERKKPANELRLG